MDSGFKSAEKDARLEILPTLLFETLLNILYLSKVRMHFLIQGNDVFDFFYIEKCLTFFIKALLLKMIALSAISHKVKY